MASADKAVEDGSAEAVLKLLTEKMAAGLHVHFHQVHAAKSFKPGDLAAGRAYVKANMG
jgi:hypothetical protein